MSLLELPTELLEEIVITTDPRTSSGRAIRLTCKTLCDVATPLVFEHLYIDFTKIEKHNYNSDAIRFLMELSQGRRLARFVRSLYFLTSSGSHKKKFRLRDVLSVWKNKKTFFDIVGMLILIAVQQMRGLRAFHWRNPDRAWMWTDIMHEIILTSLSDCPHLGFVSISAVGIKNDIPCAPFHDLTDLLIQGWSSLDYAPAIIANSPSLISFEFKISPHDSTPLLPFPVLSLFSAFPEGTYSSVQEVILAGDDLSLEPSTIPALIPHFRNLSEFFVPAGFGVPDEFWNTLVDARVHLRYVTSRDSLTDSFLNYLGGYHGLKELHLCPVPANAQGVLDAIHTRFFCHHIIPAHASSLTSVVVQSEYAGSWCFDVPMLEALLLCTNVVYIGISVDQQRAQVKGDENVITKLMENVQSWHCLEHLKIGTPILNDTTVRSPSSNDYNLKKDVCSDIAICATKFQYTDPTPQMFNLRIDTDSQWNFRLRLRDFEPPFYTFFPCSPYIVERISI
ncbi:hypothetical protein ARMGADRAFT_1164518 [Armillaria gallica]|uniref:F-box domain-containing protein n=1 Tax=Armillaria gallica TaxID=47427 RepID=A0A2H3DJE8_ARMGA|nr:hypothetical protein ARMGADRAFT_1164518 [Armillaria gallica]